MNPYFALANEEGRIKKTYAPPLSPSRSLCMNNNGYIFNQSKKLPGLRRQQLAVCRGGLRKPPGFPQKLGGVEPRNAEARMWDAGL